MRRAALAWTTLLTAVLGGCAAPAVPPARPGPAADVPTTPAGCCEERFARTRDPLQRAWLAHRLRQLREPRERAADWPWEPSAATGAHLPLGASALHRRPSDRGELAAAYRERSRLQAQAGDGMAALANALLAREHALARAPAALATGGTVPAAAPPR